MNRAARFDNHHDREERDEIRASFNQETAVEVFQRQQAARRRSQTIREVASTVKQYQERSRG